jgi:hypothetical protein
MVTMKKKSGKATKAAKSAQASKRASASKSAKSSKSPKSAKAKRPKNSAASSSGSAQVRRLAQARAEHLYRRVFVTVVVAACIAVALGLGPVYLNAQATRATQASELLKEEIAASLSISENLELRRSALLTSTRLERFATEELAMVPEDTDRMYIELQGSALPVPDAVASAAAEAGGAEQSADAAQDGFNAWAVLARLTAGEASALLVGDIGLAGVR